MMKKVGEGADDLWIQPGATVLSFAPVTRSLDMKYTHRPYTSVSLFSGIGGLDAGLHRAGFAPALCCEIDPNAYRTLSAYLQREQIDAALHPDVNDLCPDALRARLGVRPGEIDLLVGGPPCQAFSLIGKRGSLGDARGMLLYKMAEFAAALRPKVLLIEQVKGLLSAPCENGIKGGAFAQLILRLEAMGYAVSHKVLLAADYGVPQLRERVFVVASHVGHFRFPEATHGGASAPYKTVRDAIGDLPPPTLPDAPERIANHVDITPGRDRERIAGVPEGECLAKQLHLPRSQRMNLTQKDTTKFRRVAWDAPCLTLRGGEAFYHPTEDRYLTPREYLRIHGFGDDFILYGPIKGRSGTFRVLDQHRLVANAVPPALAEALGAEIVRQLLAEDGRVQARASRQQRRFAEA